MERASEIERGTQSQRGKKGSKETGKDRDKDKGNEIKREKEKDDDEDKMKRRTRNRNRKKTRKRTRKKKRKRQRERSPAARRSNRATQRWSRLELGMGGTTLSISKMSSGTR